MKFCVKFCVRIGGRWWRLMALFVAIGAFGPLLEASTINPEKVQKAIAATLTPLGKGVGLSVVSLRDKEIVAVDSEVLRPPASIIKLFSTACALKELGPAFQFETIFGSTGKIVGDRLKGDVVVRGSGDPRFVVEELREVLERLRAIYGIKQIEGDLVFDLSYLGQREISFTHDFDGDDLRAFNAPITAIPFNFNSFGVAGATYDGKAFASLLPRGFEGIQLKNEIRVGKESALTLAQKARQVVSIAGTLATTDEGRIFYRSVENPLSILADQIFFLWQQMGGEWKRATQGRAFREELKPMTFTPFFVWKSPPLSKMLIDINKLSTNFGAELVTLRAAASKHRRTPVTLEDSRRFLRDCWADTGLPATRFHLENASGLSRVTTVSPKDLAAFLIAMARDWRYPEFASSFSIVGEDGTARKRLNDLAGRGRVKTGSIKGVRSIAGYLLADSGNTYAFTMIYQGDKTAVALALEDKVMREIIEGL